MSGGRTGYSSYGPASRACWKILNARLRTTIRSLARGGLLERAARVGDGAPAERIFGPSPAIERERRVHGPALFAGARFLARVVLLGHFRRVDDGREDALARRVGIMVRRRRRRIVTDLRNHLLALLAADDHCFVLFLAHALALCDRHNVKALRILLVLEERIDAVRVCAHEDEPRVGHRAMRAERDDHFIHAVGMEELAVGHARAAAHHGARRHDRALAEIRKKRQQLRIRAGHRVEQVGPQRLARSVGWRNSMPLVFAPAHGCLTMIWRYSLLKRNSAPPPDAAGSRFSPSRPAPADRSPGSCPAGYVDTGFPALRWSPRCRRRAVRRCRRACRRAR